MGRAFEFRKARKFKRWGKMAKVFTRIGKDIVIAVKEGGPDPEYNSKLRAVIQNAKAANMPKDNIDRAIKRATDKDTEDYKEIVFEGYGPHGIAFILDCATDNNKRTVANVRSYFNKCDGSLGVHGSVEFMFDHQCYFKIEDNPEIDIEEFEFELIDYGAEEVFREEAVDDGEEQSPAVIVIYGPFQSYGSLQSYLEENKYEINSSGFERIPQTTKELTEEEAEDVEKLIEMFEDDDDVNDVFHNMA